MRVLAALLCAVLATAGLVFGVWLIYRPGAVLVGAVLLGFVAYGLLTDEERARL